MGKHKQTKQIKNRLSRIEGHVRAVKDMVLTGRDCSEILIQIAAIRSAIDKVGRIILMDHIENCIVGAVDEEHFEETIENLANALKNFIS